MAMRSLQTLDISLGLFGFQTKVYKAINDPTSGIEFRQIHADCNHPINYAKLCRTCHVEVAPSDIRKGIDAGDGAFLTFDEAEIKALRPERLGIVKIDGYLAADAVDATYQDGTVYYLSPEGKDPTTFVTFREALAGRWAVGHVVMHGRERVCVIRAMDKLLILQLLRTHAEVRALADVPKYDAVPDRAQAQYVDLLTKLMAAQAVNFEDVILTSDAYVDAVKALIDARKAGLTAPVAPVTETVAPTTNLLAALQASLAALEEAA